MGVVTNDVRSKTSIATDLRPALLSMAANIDLLFSQLNALLALTDLSGLPVSDPGGGKPWLNGGVLQVGP